MNTTPTETNGDIDVLAPQSDAEGTGGGSPVAVPRGRGRGRLFAVLALVVVVVAVVVWLAWPSSKQPVVPAHAVITPTNANAVTTVGGQELLATLRKGDTATYHLAYKVVGDPSEIGGALTLEVWQSPPQVREDTTLVQNGVTTQTESFSSGKSGNLCTRTGSAAWQCKSIAGSAAASGPAGVLSSIAAEVSGNGVTTSKQTIDNNAVTCYTVLTSAKPKLCATSSGIPLSISDSEVSYQLVSLSENVSAGVFALPTQS